MLLSTDKSEEVETPTENAYVVMLSEMGLSVHGFSNLIRAGAEQLDTLNNCFMALLNFYYSLNLLYQAENPPHKKKSTIQVVKE